MASYPCVERSKVCHSIQGRHFGGGCRPCSFNPKIRRRSKMIRLECKRGGSNKYYELDMKQSNGRVTVTGFYGAIGQAPKNHPIYDGDNKEEAIAAMQRKQLEKQ